MKIQLDNCKFRWNSPVFSIALFFLIIVVSLFLSAEHLTDELWQDEAYTLIHFSSKGFFYPFYDYHLPNNHVFFSALLAKWWFPGCSTIYLRTLPLFIFAVTLIVFPVVAARLAGKNAALFALFFFGVSSITQNFALQLRGYSVSWLPVSLSLLSLPLYVQNGIWYWGLAYVFFSAISVAILPTNIFFCGIFVVWGWIQISFDSKRRLKDYIGRLIIITIGPLLGFLAYAYVLIDFFLVSQRKISPWEWTEIIRHWLLATSVDFIPFLPFSALGFYFLLKKAREENDFSVKGVSTNIALIFSTIFIFLLWLPIFPNPPFPRNIVPFLPIWYLMLGYLTSLGLKPLFNKNNGLSLLLITALIGISFFKLYISNVSTASTNNDDFPQNLTRQYYHENFHPELTVNLIKEMVGNSSIPVLTDFDGIYCLGYILNNSEKANLKLIHYKLWKYRINDSSYIPRLIVTHSLSELERILNYIGIDSEGYIESENAGFFKIYQYYLANQLPYVAR